MEIFCERNPKVKNVGYQGVGFIHQTSTNDIDYYPAWVKTNLRIVL